MRTRLVTVLVAAILAAVLFGACGPAGPHDDAGPEADPVALLTVLPVPAGLRDVSPATAAPAAAIMDAMLGESTPEGARRLTDSGMSKSAVRVFGTASGGRMYAIVSVWPSRLVASNFALEVAQRRLGKPGFRAWTPDDVPGTQGVRQSGGGAGEGRRPLRGTERDRGALHGGRLGGRGGPHAGAAGHRAAGQGLTDAPGARGR